ncbi:FHA domain-containing protein [Spiractinospora alimapuensis]|uniref:FHA domain-containing protein n=1 Tax=Spiractinospora alimapuensis TaxID=2820884 RepID=UPI001F32AE9F|nr:FHA domain-containing protein [Spiractinospora alimapuensis]QVQ52014.1 FHA domain-containing protein [Spiractinospora alimapuensis]
MPKCPAGHESTDDEWCHVCGLGLAAPPMGPPISTDPPETFAGAPASSAAASAPPPTPAAPAGSPSSQYCPDCGLERTGNFCEGCGFAFNEPLRHVSGGQPTSGGMSVVWTAIVAAEPGYFQILADRGFLDPQVVRFPSRAPQRRIRLVGDLIRVGRRNTARGVDPEIDLSEATGDPAISHRHAELRARPDGTWVVVDVGSSNGTAVNDTEKHITPNAEVALKDGDRIFLGAWTVITLRRG